MDLTIKSKTNLDFMVGKILEKLKIINIDAIKSDSINEELYDEVYDIYQLVMKREHFSPSEMQAIAEELGNLRNKK